MARARNIKPSFFKNEILGEADPLLGLLFISLWTLADKAGRLEDRPLRIKAETFPYRENIDINGYLTQLLSLGFIERYKAVCDGKEVAIIEIVNFTRHQTPHSTEKASELPAKPVDKPITLNNESPAVNGHINVLIPDSSNTDSPNRIPDVMCADSGTPNKNGTRLPADWVLPKAWGTWALENSNLSESQIRLEAEKFKDHWLGTANRASSKRADWLATWRNWIRNAKAGPQTKTQQAKANNERAVDEFVGGGSNVIEGEVVND
jgi:hypothetical protein